MANSPVVSSLPAYVEQRRLPLISKAVLGAKTARLFTIQSGIKGAAKLNLINSDIVLQSGAACGWNEAGTSTLSQRELNTALLKINMAYCDKKLIRTWAEYGVRIAAGQKELPFEEEFVNDVVKNVGIAVDKLMWQGDTTSLDTLLKLYDGLLKILANDASVIDVTVTSGKSYFDAVKETLLAIPAEALGEDTVIMCAPEFLRSYHQDLVAMNLYHYESGRDLDEIRIPGSFVRLVAVPGLTGAKYLVAGRLSNFFYGCDMQGDEEVFEFDYAKEAKEFRLDIEFNAGVQVAFPDQVVLGAYTTLVPAASVSAALADIKTNTAGTATATAALADADHVYKTKEQA